ncbi:disintegrin and metalloproteinase domain-containing protein 10-like [Rhinatrema bivittatum]|uniref:disintegrin and metalloproteinase domain-containing protein 10-like n=1 Tax=Rhinatrema bivittatum TaxID=194408 RepID=UPI00112657CE|nr:disintegrin and metalloproteinase domain-containing protein 10-like [Rhinatrema bivittatum]
MGAVNEPDVQWKAEKGLELHAEKGVEQQGKPAAQMQGQAGNALKVPFEASTPSTVDLGRNIQQDQRAKPKRVAAGEVPSEGLRSREASESDSSDSGDFSEDFALLLRKVLKYKRSKRIRGNGSRAADHGSPPRKKKSRKGAEIAHCASRGKRPPRGVPQESDPEDSPEDDTESAEEPLTGAGKAAVDGDNAERSFIKYFEKLSYDKKVLDQEYQRARRATEEHEKRIHLEFPAHKRTFRMRLQSDTSVFADNFEISGIRTSLPTDISYICSGELQDEEGSSCYGSIMNGRFEGFIETENGTYYVEPAEAHSKTENGTYHSYIYHEKDIDYSLLEEENASCSAVRMHQIFQNSKMELKAEGTVRTRRSIDYSRTTCLMYLKADYLFYKRFGSVEAVIAQIAGYMRAVNTIYEEVDFNGIKHINFKVKRLNVAQEDDSMYSDFIGPEKLLRLHSESNWNSYCLSYLLTDRDYSGVLGLAWNGKAGNSGGICSKYAKLQDESEASLNTGLITIQKYGRYLPPRLIHITLAHELGHSLGAPHDEGKECSSFNTNSKEGNYLMFPYAMDGNQHNNDKFSSCSVAYIGNILQAKKDQCFAESDRPICGNQIVEQGEECDVGPSDSDPCCYGASASDELRCRLQPGKHCSPSQGLCCNHQCDYKPQGTQCQEESECKFESHCSGESAICSEPAPKDNYTLCNTGTRICLNGFCHQSLCVRYGLEQCDCDDSMHEKCHLCCQQPGNDRTCTSTSSMLLKMYFNGSKIPLPPGSPCDQNQGYCDKFHICQLVDADGPIARLKNSILNLIELEDISTWMKVHWWAILLIILTLAALMAGTVFLFGRTLDTEYSRKEDNLKGKTLKPVCHGESENIVYWEREEFHIETSHVEYETRI